MAELSVHVFAPLCILLLTVPVSACVCVLVCVNGAVTVCAGSVWQGTQGQLEIKSHLTVLC